MVSKIFLVLIFAFAMSPAHARSFCPAEPETAASARTHEGHAPQRKQDRARPADSTCIGCVAPSTLKRPLLEAPAPGLLMIPAALLVTEVVARPARPAVPPPKRG